MVQSDWSIWEPLEPGLKISMSNYLHSTEPNHSKFWLCEAFLRMSNFYWRGFFNFDLIAIKIKISQNFPMALVARNRACDVTNRDQQLTLWHLHTPSFWREAPSRLSCEILKIRKFDYWQIKSNQFRKRDRVWWRVLHRGLAILAGVG